MIDHLCRRTTLSRAQAYMLCSLAGDLRVTQVVDGNKGVHMVLAKAHLAPAGRGSDVTMRDSASFPGTASIV